MYCNKCGKPIPDGSVFCNACGAPQQARQVPPPQYRQAPPPQQQQASQKMPTSYYVDSWVLFGLCIACGLIRCLIGFTNGSERDMYKGIVTCCTSLIFIPPIKVSNSPTATLLIKIAVAIGVVMFI
jgi:hypothetical protein